mmetsp:Transcript_23301/g.74850  ORF Transcript_23301/g.74850 Transcript_23301/m.74850 type:complete len:178 (+) Transcript_23301:18-551(+)
MFRLCCIVLLCARSVATGFAPEAATKTAMRPASLSSLAPLSLPMVDSTRAVVDLRADSLREIANGMNGLLQLFQDSSPGRKKPSFEYSHSADPFTIDLECNPNASPDPFKTKVAVRLRSNHLDVTSEVALTTLVDESHHRHRQHQIDKRSPFSLRSTLPSFLRGWLLGHSPFFCSSR